MAYTWTNGEVITAEKLNQTGGGGFFPVTFNYDSSTESVTSDKTNAEIYAAYESGMMPIGKLITDGETLFIVNLYLQSVPDEDYCQFISTNLGMISGSPTLTVIKVSLSENTGTFLRNAFT